MTPSTGDRHQDAHGLAHDPRWQLVERIVATPAFIRSARLSSLLLYVTKHALLGDQENLSEQLLGEQVFNRSVGYDSRDDNIVRSHASRLRQRLEVYFRDEAPEEPLRVSIPRGSYVPHFERRPLATPLSGPSTAAKEAGPPVVSAEAPQTVLPSPRHRPERRLLGLAAALLVALTLGTVGWLWLPHKHVSAGSMKANHRLWLAMFDNDRDTLVVPADSSLVLLQHFTGKPVNLADYASGRYLAEIRCAQPCDTEFLKQLVRHRYTSMADLKFAVDLTRLPEAVSNRTEVRFARDLQMDDLKQKNLVLIGSAEADPWVKVFEKQLNFVLRDDQPGEPPNITNLHPTSGEQANYRENDQSGYGYATISFLSNLSNSGHVLIVQGFTLAGTQAAAEFLASNAFNTFLSTTMQHGTKLPTFELLLKTVDVNGVASVPAVVAVRYR